MNYFTTIALYLAAFIGAATVAEGTNDYCDEDLCTPENRPHIACGHSYQFDRTCPRDAMLVEITPKLRNLFLQLHNEKRNLIAGGGAPKHRPACRMATMQWDDELAKLAELNVKQCEMNHDKCHNTKSFPMSSQNLGFKSYYGAPNHSELIADAVQGWYDEIKDSNMKIINKFPERYSGPIITHFTGMVIESNTHIGCAVSTYSSQGEGYKIHLTACNMAKLTMSTSPVYTSCRKPGSKCTSGRNSMYPNLCNTSENYN